MPPRETDRVSWPPASVGRPCFCQRNGSSVADGEAILHVCQVIRPGKFIVQRMFNQVGMPPGQPLEEKYTSMARGGHGA